MAAEIDIAVFVVLVVVLVKYWIGWRKKRMTLLQRCGIPGPEPNFITGNLQEALSTPNVLFDTFLSEKYGNICGYYLGAKPIVLVTDPCLLKIIQVEKSKEFYNRPRRVPGGISADPMRKEMLGNLPVDEWKVTRKTLTKGFTSHNLKEMIPQIMGKISIFLEKVRTRRRDGEMDFYPLFQGLALDIIGQTGFGVDCNIQENIDDPLHAAVQAEFSKSTSTLLVQIFLCAPELQWIIQPVRVFCHKIASKLGWNSSKLWSKGFEALRQRLSGSPRQDLLQKLVDSPEIGNNPKRIVANTVLFFEAAYETLSSGLAFCVHFLVNNLEIQAKVREEINTVLGSELLPAYEMLNELKYLERVIKETLRIYPPQTTFIGRSGEVDLMYGDITIPAGVHIQAGLFQLQNSDKYWDNPTKFDPDRFLCSKHEQNGWQPFGNGPRKCIGERFAWIVLKLVLATLLRSYQLTPCSKTERQIELHFKTATMTPKNGSFAFCEPTI